jgi:hypothetical protein
MGILDIPAHTPYTLVKTRTEDESSLPQRHGGTENNNITSVSLWLIAHSSFVVLTES